MAQQNIGTLAAVISANSDGFLSGSDRASKSAEAFANKLKQQAATFGLTKNEARLYQLQLKGASDASIAAARAADEHIKALEKQKSGMGEGVLGKIGGAVGISPEMLGMAGAGAAVGLFASYVSGGVHQLAELSRQARIAGIDVSTFSGIMSLAGSKSEEMEHALTRLNEHLSEATSSKEAASKFSGLGVEIGQATGTADALQMVAKRYQELGSASDKARLLQELFGRQGRELGIVFDKFGGDVYGAVVSLGAADTEMGKLAEASEKFDRQMTRAWNNIKITVAGGLLKLGEDIKGFYNSYLSFTPGEAKTSTQTGTKTLRESQQEATAKKLTQEFESQADTFGLTARQVQIYKAELDGLSDSQLASARAIDDQLTYIENLRGSMVSTGNIFEDYRIKWDKFVAARKEGKITGTELANEMGKLDAALKTTSQNKAAEIIASQRSELEKFKSTMAELVGLNEAYTSSAGSAGLSAEKFGKAAFDTLQKAGASLGFGGDHAPSLERAGTQGAEAIITGILNKKLVGNDPTAILEALRAQAQAQSDALQRFLPSLPEILDALKNQNFNTVSMP